MVYMGYKFRAPKLSDVKAWKKIEDAIARGIDLKIAMRRIPRNLKLKPKRNHYSTTLTKSLGL